MKVTRLATDTQKIETDFGNIYVHVRYTTEGRPCGLSLSHHVRDMQAPIAELIETIATGIDSALRP
jgi:hypothetical protein